jgi:hypothetical protein
LAEEAGDILGILVGCCSKELLFLIGPGFGNGAAPRGSICLLLRGGLPTISTTSGFSVPREGLTLILILEATGLASLLGLGGLLLGLILPHQLSGRLEEAGAFGEASSHPLGFEL